MALAFAQWAWSSCQNWRTASSISYLSLATCLTSGWCGETAQAVRWLICLCQASFRSAYLTFVRVSPGSPGTSVLVEGRCSVLYLGALAKTLTLTTVLKFSSRTFYGIEDRYIHNLVCACYPRSEEACSLTQRPRSALAASEPRYSLAANHAQVRGLSETAPALLRLRQV